jgi:quercetin dioxygenase-like cupin family protein
LSAHKSNTDASILVLEGEVIFKINGEEYLMKRHDMYSFKKEEVHAIEAITNAKLVLIK